MLKTSRPELKYLISQLNKIANNKRQAGLSIFS